MNKKKYIPREKIRENSCPICYSDDIRKFLYGKTHLIECNSCKVVYNRYIPSKKQTGDYYKFEYRVSDNSTIDSERRRIFRLPEQLQLIIMLNKYRPAPAKLLDVGCDKGYFLDEARRWGYEVRGIEPSEQARQYCRKIGLKTNVYIKECNEKFDIITLWHSLEHQRNPKSALTEMKYYLNTGGYIFIRVPAFDSFWSRIFKEKWIWFQPENHYFHFTEDGLKNILSQAGYEPIEIIKRKPNNRYTSRMFNTINSLLKRNNISQNKRHKNSGINKGNTGLNESKNIIKSKGSLSRMYQDITGIELFAVARKKVEGI